ncbi:hypothetical protein ACFPRL_07195 [Pseudoclavibacter helvolus]
MQVGAGDRNVEITRADAPRVAGDAGHLDLCACRGHRASGRIGDGSERNSVRTVGACQV